VSEAGQKQDRPKGPAHPKAGAENAGEQLVSLSTQIDELVTSITNLQRDVTTTKSQLRKLLTSVAKTHPTIANEVNEARQQPKS
jgi:peptidoglycan hydrolase CwlO-like protein